MSMIRWTREFTFKQRKKNTQLTELLGLELVGSVIRKGRLWCLDTWSTKMTLIWTKHEGIRLIGWYQRLLHNVMHNASKPDDKRSGCDAFLPPVHSELI